MHINTEYFAGAANCPHNLVLIHGWGICSRIFYPLVPLLQKYCNVTLLDLPGYGINHQIPANRCDGIQKILEETLPNNIILLGWSLGATLALRYTITNPNKVKGLITCAGSPRFCADPTSSWPGTEATLLQKFASILKMDNCNSIIDKFLSLQAMGSETLKQDIRTMKKLIAEVETPSYYELQAGLKTLMDEDLRGYISRITCPSLHIYGARDRLVPATSAQIWHQKANAKICIMPASSHAPFITEPKNFAQEIASFLQNLK